MSHHTQCMAVSFTHPTLNPSPLKHYLWLSFPSYPLIWECNQVLEIQTLPLYGQLRIY